MKLRRSSTTVADDGGPEPSKALTGTLGVLQALHRAGLVDRSLAEDLDALDAAGMYLTDDLKRRVMAPFGAHGA